MVLVSSAHTNIMIFTTWEEIYYLHETWDYHISAQSMLSAWKKAWVLSYPLSAQRRLWSDLADAQADLHSEDWSDWADAQADLSIRWAHSHFVDFVMRWLISEFFSNWSLMPFNLFLTLRSISGFNKRLTPQACFKKNICHMASRLTV